MSVQVGQHIFDGTRVRVVSEIGSLLVQFTDGGAPLTSDAAERQQLLPLPGTPITYGGKEMIWVTELTVVAEGVLRALLIQGDSVLEGTVDVGRLEERPGERFDERACVLLAKQHRENVNAWELFNDAANDAANEFDLCERYDEFMAGQGLRRRTRDFEATVTVKFYVDRQGTDFDDAYADFNAEDVLELMRQTIEPSFEVEEI